MSEMRKLTGEEYVYEMKIQKEVIASSSTRYTVEQIEQEVNYLKSTILCEETIQIKLHAQVMCITNIVLSNGTFSFLIGLFGYNSIIYFPTIKIKWHGDIFIFPDWNRVDY
jgi:hypothetical protein